MAKGRRMQYGATPHDGQDGAAEITLPAVTPEGLYDEGIQAPQSGGVQGLAGVTR